MLTQTKIKLKLHKLAILRAEKIQRKLYNELYFCNSIIYRTHETCRLKGKINFCKANKKPFNAWLEWYKETKRLAIERKVEIEKRIARVKCIQEKM